jgi:formate hydrogenlyase subunit 3/multisubunit Na+/H+ antiporter MnhD subunit
MTALWLPIALGVPLLLAPFCVWRPTRQTAFAIAPWSPWPALVLAAVADAPTQTDISPLLLTVQLALDATARTFLLFTAVIAWLAGLAMQIELRHDDRRFRFAAFYVAAVAGNIGVVLAADIASFYACFALMTFAAYGLVMHNADARAHRAGRVYIVMAVAGEAMLLAGLLIIGADGLLLADAPTAVAESAQRGWIVALLLGGFGVKAGLLPLHVTLPLAYAAAPIAGAAFLAGAMINAGLLGLLRFLPVGLAALPAWGATGIIVGFTGVFYGTVVGVMQTDPKAALAYSSISQMGFVIAILGVALSLPSLAPIAFAAAVVYATHHALAKAALFLALGTLATRYRYLGVFMLLVLSLSLAGAPFTSGAVAKLGLKETLAPATKFAVMQPLLSLGALGTALLMARFLFLALQLPRAMTSSDARFVGVAALAFLASASLIWAIPQVDFGVVRQHWRTWRVVWDETWPVLIAIAITVLLTRAGRQRGWGTVFRVPPGDVVMIGEWLARVTLDVSERATKTVTAVWDRASTNMSRPSQRKTRGIIAVDAILRRWSTAMTLFLVLIAVLVLLFASAHHT